MRRSRLSGTSYAVLCGSARKPRAAETHRARITPAPSSHGARRRRPPLALTGVALAALLLPAVHAPHLRLVWNASASLPTGLYAIEPEADMRVGDLALEIGRASCRERVCQYV